LGFSHFSRQYTTSRFASNVNDLPLPRFGPGDKVQVEVVSFGPLGASVEVIGKGHGEDADLLPADAEPYGTGLILQKEISYFRSARNNVDVVRGEVLPAYIQNIREEDGKMDIGLRAFGGKAKSKEAGDQIMDRLNFIEGGILPIGDKSSPEEINKQFPGVSKASFKKAVGALYKKGLIKPSHNSITLA
jgi:predicted RNA-binding protein (virulence factor B family)